MKALITGISGFVGPYLAGTLLEGNIEVIGVSRRGAEEKTKYNVVQADILDKEKIEEIIIKSSPDYIFHLAGYSNTSSSWESTIETLNTNIIGCANLLEACRKLDKEVAIQLACSSNEYGLVADSKIPITEDQPFMPMSPYAVSKAAVDLLGFQYYQSYGMSVIRTRAFNHTGPGRGEEFAESNFAKQIAEIEKGVREPIIMVGNLEAIRDFTDVRDVVKAYWLAISKGSMGDVYNICSGKGYKIADLLNILISFSNKKVKVEEDPARFRPSDVPVLVGDNSKFVKATGWKREFTIEETLEDLLNYWRNTI